MAGKDTIESLRLANTNLRKDLEDEKRKSAQLNREKVGILVYVVLLCVRKCWVWLRSHALPCFA